MVDLFRAANNALTREASSQNQKAILRSTFITFSEVLGRIP